MGGTNEGRRAPESPGRGSSQRHSDHQSSWAIVVLSVLRRRCAGRESQGEREIERGGRGGERREKNGGGSAWAFSPCTVGFGGSAAVLLHLLRALPDLGPRGKRLNIPSTGPRTVIGLLQVSGSTRLFMELLHVMNVRCLFSKSATRPNRQRR